jgi:hypothetical protein
VLETILKGLVDTRDNVRATIDLLDRTGRVLAARPRTEQEAA